MKEFYVLGIHDGHNSGASLLKNGKIIASISEERISRRKNEVGYPRKAIEAILNREGVSPQNLQLVTFASNFMHAPKHLEEITPWYRVGLEDQKRHKIQNKDYDTVLFNSRKQEREQEVRDHLGFQGEISFVEHHTAHAAAAYFGSPWSLEEPVLVVTCDGAGDGLSGSISVGKNGKLERLAVVNRSNSLGKLYSRVTYLLGMKPWEHEYKVMGMAPYATDYQKDKAKNVFESLLGLNSDHTEFSLKTELETHYSYFYLRDHLENVRFDAVCGGIQEFTEEILKNWVHAWVKKTGITKVALGGGVFMNVKANLSITKIDELSDVFVCPSCGDESLSLGAVSLEYYKRTNDTQKYPFETIYWGHDFTNEEIDQAIKKYDIPGEVTISFIEDIDHHVGNELADNKVVARFNGKMEWGARALGNRSILANPAFPDNIKIINAMIKKRDFWMPFSPSILEERLNDYVYNPKNIVSPFMMHAFDGKAVAEEELPAASHPYDLTLRAQSVNKHQNRGYYNVIKSYENRTGKGGILNTSFNLHGYPIVCFPEDALFVFANSGLNNLAIGNYYLTKS